MLSFISPELEDNFPPTISHKKKTNILNICIAYSEDYLPLSCLCNSWTSYLVSVTIENIIFKYCKYNQESSMSLSYRAHSLQVRLRWRPHESRGYKNSF